MLLGDVIAFACTFASCSSGSGRGSTLPDVYQHWRSQDFVLREAWD